MGNEQRGARRHYCFRYVQAIEKLAETNQLNALLERERPASQMAEQPAKADDDLGRLMQAAE
jgi:hypothetical protein